MDIRYATTVAVVTVTTLIAMTVIILNITHTLT